MPSTTGRIVSLLTILTVLLAGGRFILASERDRASGRTSDVALAMEGRPLVVPKAPADPAPAPAGSPRTGATRGNAGAQRTDAPSRRSGRSPSGSSTTPSARPPAPSTTGYAVPGVDPAWLARTSGATGIPTVALSAYVRAANTTREATPGCHLSWNTLAALGAVESDHGRHGGVALDDGGTARPAITGPALDGKEFAHVADTDHGQLDGDPTLDRAVGPLQFIPSTWRLFAADGNADGRHDAQNIWDASLAAARYLCDGGRDLTQGQDWWGAVASYNHSVEYVRAVLGQANLYARQSSLPRAAATTHPPRALSLPQGAYPLPGLATLPVLQERGRGTPGAVVAAALSQQGVPYAWGGGGPVGPGEGFARGAGTVGFDCSSLMQFAFAQGAGLVLPRVSQQQKDAGRPVAVASIRPGDIIVFSGHGWGHVGLYVGEGLMVHAPFTGARVRVQDLASYRDQQWRVRRLL